MKLFKFNKPKPIRTFNKGATIMYDNKIDLASTIYPATLCSLGYLTGFPKKTLEAQNLIEGQVNKKPIVAIPIYDDGILINRIIISGFYWDDPFIHSVCSVEKTTDGRFSWPNVPEAWFKDKVIITDNLFMAIQSYLFHNQFIYSGDLDYLRKISVELSSKYRSVHIYSNRIHRWFEKDWEQSYPVNVFLMPENACWNLRTPFPGMFPTMYNFKSDSSFVACELAEFFKEICIELEEDTDRTDVIKVVPESDGQITSTDCPFEYQSAFENLREQIGCSQDTYDMDGFFYHKGEKTFRYPFRRINPEKVKRSIPLIVPLDTVSPRVDYSDYVINNMVDDGIFKRIEMYNGNDKETIYFMNEFEERFGFFDNYHLSERHYE